MILTIFRRELMLARCVDRLEQMAETHHRVPYPSYDGQDEV